MSTVAMGLVCTVTGRAREKINEHSARPHSGYNASSVSPNTDTFMRTPRIYTSQPLTPGAHLELEKNAANHIGRVLRMKAGQRLKLFNGNGRVFQGEIVAVTKKATSVSLMAEETPQVESPLRIVLGQAMSRGERMDYAIQKAIELGIAEITPLFTERCEVRLSTERQEKRRQHWEKVVISACEQCGRNTLPIIHPPASINDWLSCQTTDLRFVLHHRTEKKLEGYDRPESVSLLVGPEGGLTMDEIALAEKHQCHALSLGPRVMRTETAPIAAAGIMHYVWGDFQ